MHFTPGYWKHVGYVGDYVIWIGDGAYQLTRSVNSPPTGVAGYFNLESLLTLKGLSVSQIRTIDAEPRKD